MSGPGSVGKQRARYRRLPGQALGGFSVARVARHSLWLGPDHVLAVTNQSYSETYKRFYFSDIQALLLHRTAAWTAQNTALGAVAGSLAGLALGGWTLRWHPAAIAAILGAAGAVGLALLVNWLRGPTCACRLRTAVQTEPLPSLCRLRPAMRVIGMLRERIESVQGALSEADAGRDAALPAGQAAAGGPRPARPVPRPPRLLGRALPLRPVRGWAHEALFAVLLADLCHTCVRFFAGGGLMLAIGAALGVAMVAATVAALVRQQGADLPRGAKAAAWGALGYLVFTHVYGIVYGALLAVAHPETAGSSWEQARMMSRIQAFDAPPMFVFLAVSALLGGLLGFGGLLSLARSRRGRESR